jgi:ADP-L-glycero-D-manno-heptose 6-epimerase
MILITGYKGFIGQNMMKAFNNVRGYEWGEGYVDLTDVTHVIHLGAISSTACEDEMQLRLQNIDFSIGLLNRCAIREIPFQFASSASVYGPHATTFSESDPVAPANLYAKSKYAVESYIAHKEWPMPVQVFRYFNVYGPHEEHKDQPSPYTKFSIQAKTKGYIELFEGSENYKRDFVSVDVVIDIHKKLLDKSAKGVYNIGTGIAKSFRDVAEEVAAQYAVPIIEIPFPQHLSSSYQRYTKADMTKLNSTLRHYYGYT